MSDSSILGGTTTVAGVVGATSTILLTTLDDCVWLVPFVAQASSRSVAWEHASLFAATLIGLTTVVSILTIILQQGVHRVASTKIDFDLIWCGVGAAFCWGLAGYFYFRSWQKKKRRQREAAERQDEEKLLGVQSTSYGSDCVKQTEGVTCNSISLASSPDSDHDSHTAVTSAQPLAVISLTVVGALDEVSYFPALIVGKVFTVPELVLGTLLTVIIMLFVVLQCLAQCRPLLDLLDRVPLYAVVAAFAILLTAEVLWDLLDSNNE